MAKSKKQTQSSPNKVSDEPNPVVPAGLEEETWSTTPTGKLPTVQVGWAADEQGEPVAYSEEEMASLEAETQGWAAAVAKEEEPWDGQLGGVQTDLHHSQSATVNLNLPDDEAYAEAWNNTVSPVIKEQFQEQQGAPDPNAFPPTEEEKEALADTSTIPDFAGLATAVGQPESWEAQPDGVAEDDWGAGANLLLNIERHSGKFEPHVAKIMIYGDTGTQKTRTACTFPDALVVDVDHGMSSVDWEVDKVYIPDNDKGFRYMEEVYRMLEGGQHEYETVVLDTLNEMQRVIMRFTVEEYTTVRRSYGSLPGQSDYGFMLYQFIELTRKFISLPMRVVLLAQVNSQQFETDILGPQLIGKNSARDLMRKMDVIGYIYKAEAEEGTVPEITFDATNYMTKDRSHRLPAALRNPTYGRISAYWK